MIKIKQITDCKNGKHVFLITGWMTSGGKQKAVAMRCQHCLMPLHLEEIESEEWRKEEGV